MSDATQLSYSESPAVGRPGMEFDISAANDVVSWIADEAIPFGVWVSETVEGHCELPDTSAEITTNKGGIALIDPSKASQAGYAIGDLVRVMRRGRCFVLSEETLTKGDTLFARFATGTGTQKGAFRNDADTASAATPTGASLYRGGGINLAVLELTQS
jgi:hypothetical protein